MNVAQFSELGYAELCEGVYVACNPDNSLLDLAQLTGSQTLPHDQSGTVVWDIKPDSDAEKTARSHGMHEFTPHTDASFDAIPPRFVALEVVAGDRFGGGVQTFLPLSSLLKTMDSSHVPYLTNDYNWNVPLEFVIGNEHSRSLPVLFGSADETYIRYREDCVDLDSALPESKLAFQALVSAIKCADFVSHIPHEGEQIIIDNYRVLHARTKVKDARRHLKRIRLT